MTRRSFRRVFVLLSVLIACALIVLPLYRKGFFRSPDFSLLQDKKETSKLFDVHGEIFREYCTYCRETITLERMGYFPGLAVAVEDKNFWTRPFALDIWGIARAAKQDIKNWKTNQGGSTITQQATRSLLLWGELAEEKVAKDSGSRSGYMRAKWWRKMREIWVAHELEQHLSRKEILELYLNNAYCRNGRYGIESCSRFYFNKSAKELDIVQAAYIISIWRNPSVSAFDKSQEANALALRNRVLGQLKKEGVINNEMFAELAQRPLPGQPFLNRPDDDAHFAEYVRREIVKNGRLVDRGLKIYTTIDNNLQRVTLEALRSSIEAMQERNPEIKRDLWGTAILLDAKTGAINVLAQWPRFKENEYLADQIRRHAGSSFKPFEYAAMIEKKNWRLSCKDDGSGPCRLDDSPRLSVSMGHGRQMHHIQNFPYLGIPRYRGSLEPITAIGESRNAATMSAVVGVRGSSVPAASRVSKEEIVDTAVRLGISKPEVDPGLTVGIGSIDVSPLEMVAAWTGFLGNKVTPYAIEKIVDADGKTRYETALQQPSRTLEEKVSLAILRGLRATAELPHGTANKAQKELGFQVMGKTGTATDWSGETTDNWFIGCSPSYCMAIWIGREKKLPLKTTIDANGRKIQETGGTNALPVFIAAMKAIYKNRPKEEFPEQTDPHKPFFYKENQDMPNQK